MPPERLFCILLLFFLALAVAPPVDVEYGVDHSAPTPSAIIEIGSGEEGTFEYSQGQKRCHGFEEEFMDCGLPACIGNCVPVDCKFGDWSDWVGHGGCSGLELRQRSIALSNNNCGNPCAGAKEETRRSATLNPDCQTHSVPCALTAWSQWTSCKSELDQAYRKRDLLNTAQKDGDPCNGVLKEARQCGHGRQPRNCVFDDWQDWTTCSTTCGKGRHTRMRDILVTALNGDSCRGETLITEDCEDRPCPDQDCLVSDWADWSACSDDSVQKNRLRSVKQTVMGAGKACNNIALKEIAPCKLLEPQEPCKLSDWTEWTSCDRTCSGGQMFRKRVLSTQAKSGGMCPRQQLNETRSCKEEVLCSIPPSRCKLGEWTTWGKCNEDCGVGSSERTRVVTKYADRGGLGCTGPLTESKPCTGLKNSTCELVDCNWDDWCEWSACSCTCGGGTKRRNRGIKNAPRHGGKRCKSRSKSEVAPCNTQSCDKACKDGKWGPWTGWSDCSATCDAGYRSRSRVVAVEANSCGKPLAGLHTIYESCPAKLDPCIPDTDCQLGQWSDWSDCSCTCFGITERSRVIKSFVSGKGKACARESLKEIASCNPSVGGEPMQACGIVPNASCKWNDWEQWSKCDRPCGGGQRQRSRKIANYPSGTGVPCEGPSSVIQPCHRFGGDLPDDKPCAKPQCVDCKFAPWGDWSECSHCGEFSNCGGQKIRHRVLERMPNFCGKLCESTVAKEVANCTHGRQYILSCRWREWSAPSDCGGCAPAVASRNRILGLSNQSVTKDSILFTGPKTALCAGAQISYDTCKRPDYCHVCEPRDCTFNDWSDWGPPTCEGLCERKRTVKEANNHCGDPCHGNLVSTKKCNPDCNPQIDCEFGSWSDWTSCTNAPRVTGQRGRNRSIVTLPLGGGVACEGAIQKTEPCGSIVPSTDCEIGPWSTFTACSATCGGGVKTRTRKIISHATFVGELCKGSLKEIDSCASSVCPRPDCQFTKWGDWGGCEDLGQRYRYRKLVSSVGNVLLSYGLAPHASGHSLQRARQLSAHTDQLGEGKTCNGSTRETKHCPHPPVNCRLGGWTAWDICSKTCGGGQKRRQRQIERFDKNDGRPCGWPDSNASLMQTAGCSSNPCPRRNCELSNWALWSTCSVSCGYGQKSRMREITSFRLGGGDGCDATLLETVSCLIDPSEVDDCGVKNCVWGDWSAWSGCTCTCAGGMKTRTRHIVQAPRKGGSPCPVHAKEEIVPCNTQPCPKKCVDGEFASWSSWAKCSASCDGGVTYRSRKIAVTANQCGRAPDGKKLESKFCNVGVNCGISRDCLFGDWSDWSDCSCSCDGIKRRERRVQQFGLGDGKFCEGNMKETGPCNPDVDELTPAGCPAPNDPAVDCKVEEWGDWSGCSETCGDGVQNRSRRIVIQPQHGGKRCPSALTVLRQCNVDSCHPPPIDCKVSAWQEWGACYKCGGLRKRFRHISRFPKYGGKPCPHIATAEDGICKRSCHGTTYCTWRDWGDWSSCMAKCGAATKSRKRYLMTVETKKIVKATGRKRLLLDTLGDKSQRMQQLKDNRYRIHETALAFACGALSFVVGLTAWKLFHSHNGRNQPQQVSYTPVPTENFDRQALEMRVPFGGRGGDGYTAVPTYE